MPVRHVVGRRTGRAWTATVLTAGVLLITACSSEGDTAEPYASPRATASSAAVPEGTAPGGTAPGGTAPGGTAPGGTASAPTRRATGRPDLSAPQTVATGLRVPWGLAFLPDSSALVAERDSGRVLRVSVGGGAPREVYRVPGVSAGGEGGLLGLAVAADHARTGWVYAYHTAAADNRIVRFTLDGGAPEVIFDGIDRAGVHNGGRIAFGPDGMLYVGTGDAGDRPASQNPDDTNGKILRLTPDGRPAPGNPRAGSPVYSLGHRNVQGLAWDSTGRLYGIEFGQNRLDEVNVITPGGNYGWPEVEGTGGGARYVDPVVTWRTTDASPSGAAVVGDTLYVAALRGERLWTVPVAGGEPTAELTRRYGRLRTVEVAPDGALWLTTSNTDGRGDVRDGDDRILRFVLR